MSSRRYATTLRNLGLVLVACQCNPWKPCDNCTDAATKRDRILTRLAATKHLDYHKPEATA